MKNHLLILISSIIILSSTHAQIWPGMDTNIVYKANLDSVPAFIELEDSLNSIWSVGMPKKNIFDSAYTAPNCLITDNDTVFYNNNVKSAFVFKAPVLGYQAQIVEFTHRYDTEIGKDGGYIEVSDNMGKSWANVIHETDSTTYLTPYYFNVENLYTYDDSLHNKENGFSGNSQGWVTTKIQWVWYLPVKTIPDTILLRFVFTSDSVSSNHEGWLIDELASYSIFLGTAVKEVQVADIAEVYPNPSTNKILFNLKAGYENKEVELNLFDTQGNIVQKNTYEAGKQIEVYKKTLPSGVYIYSLRLGEKIERGVIEFN